MHFVKTIWGKWKEMVEKNADYGHVDVFLINNFVTVQWRWVQQEQAGDDAQDHVLFPDALGGGSKSGEFLNSDSWKKI